MEKKTTGRMVSYTQMWKVKNIDKYKAVHGVALSPKHPSVAFRVVLKLIAYLTRYA